MLADFAEDVRGKRVIRRQSSGKKLIEQSHIRLYCITVFFLLSFGAISWRLVEVTILHQTIDTASIGSPLQTEEQLLEEITAPLPLARSDIVDRNGVVLATTLSTESLFANPHDLSDPVNIARRIASIFPGIDAAILARKLKRDATFVWIKRNMTPSEQQAANSLGIPGLYFQPEQRRVYPQGNLLSHVIGFVGTDDAGLAGIERRFNDRLRDTKDYKEPLALSIDVRVQNIVHEAIKQGMTASNAIGATGIVLDLHSGEILALDNLPDFDPHQPASGVSTARFNRASLGTYEMGSTFKTFTTAMALDYGVANLTDSVYDATHPFQYDRFIIHDAHAQNRWLTVPEIYAYSSNIGTARMALDIGLTRQKAFLRKLGLMDPIDIELPERSNPHYPQQWHEINGITIAYGHGMSVTPLHLIRAFASIVDGGILPTLTLLKDGNEGKKEWPRVISEKTSRQMCRLMRMVVEHGTAKKANVPGYRVGGKTGTAEKVEGGGYSHSAKLALFISTFPTDNPQYAVLVMVDEPKGTKATFDFATGGWIAAPIVGDIVARIGPLLGVKPEYEIEEDPVNQRWVNNANERFEHAVSY